MIDTCGFLPIFELSRGSTIESVHYGALAVVNVHGRLIAHYGDPDLVTFLRSSAKPFQVLPFLEHGGRDFYDLSAPEIAVMCASHSGSDQHAAVIKGIQARAGLSEADLLCGVHTPLDESTAEALRERKEPPSPLRHNCSGKHTGILAYARMSNRNLPDLPYISPAHPIQGEILNTLAEMCQLEPDQVAPGTDGCSLPNFALPLQNAATAYARLCDPGTGQVAPAARRAACCLVTESMMGNPFMVAGTGRFDTCLMETARGRMISKGGAEGYQGIGILPGMLADRSEAIGIALKIADGDARGRVRSAVALEILRQLGALSAAELENLASFGPEFTLDNWRKIRVGRGRPIFNLEYDA